MHHLPVGTITLLFTDLEGSTHLLEQLGERYTEVLAKYRSLLRTTFQAHNGHEVDTQGDSFFVAFARASDAVSAAVEIQRTLFAYAWPNGASRTYNTPARSFSYSLLICQLIFRHSKPSIAIQIICLYSPHRSSGETSKWLPSCAS